jgi:hypothetical protein
MLIGLQEWIVDYDENIQQEADDDEAYEDDENWEQDEEIDKEYNQINEEEIEDLVEDQREQANPNQHCEDDRQGDNEAKEEEEQSDDDANAVILELETDSQGSELKRSERESRPVSRLEPNMSGKSYVQNDKKTIKKVVFAEDKLKQLEYCHNLVLQVKPTEEQTIEYGSSQGMLIARFIQDITRNVNEHGASFAQQYIVQKGLKVFGNKGHKASKKEIDQLHRRMCFAPLMVKEMKPSERKKAQMELMFLKAKEERDVVTCNIRNAFIQA